MNRFVAFVSQNNPLKLGKPELMRKFIPDWYKQSEASFIDSRNGMESGSGLKVCVPYLDIMVSGYALVTPFDIYVYTDPDGGLNVKWNGPDDLADTIETRPKEQGALIPRPEGHHWEMLVFTSKWGFKTPRGYSIMVTHPFNRHDLPFTTTSGLMDSDKFWANGSIPFFIKKGFEGTIPAGTPIAQLIPVKRNSWKASYNQGLLWDVQAQGMDARTKDKSYKKKYWIRKKFD
jgi:antitoxin (DNA-binding transcriptional repressor) of toxin-antitoxin stability system